jgi:hypothetical protein
MWPTLRIDASSRNYPGASSQQRPQPFEGATAFNVSTRAIRSFISV